MSKYASASTAEECEAFSQGTAPDKGRWWYRGDTEQGCRRLVISVKPFDGFDIVHFSSCTDGCQHRAEHTHVIRARVHVVDSRQYSLDDHCGNGLIREGELWLHVKDPRCIMVDRDYVQPLAKVG